MMKHFSFWQRWLFVVGLLIILCGLLLALMPCTPLFDLFNHLISPTFWVSSEVDQNAIEFQKFVYGVLGATMAGWGVFLSFIAWYPFKNKEPWSWYCILIGLLTWFCIDTSISVFYKVYLNAIINIIFLILVLLPILFSKDIIIKASAA